MYSPARSNDVASGMKPDQSKQLKIGQRVAWHDSLTDQGTITASDWSGVRIAWDNGKTQFFTTTTRPKLKWSELLIRPYYLCDLFSDSTFTSISNWLASAVKLLAIFLSIRAVFG